MLVPEHGFVVPAQAVVEDPALEGSVDGDAIPGSMRAFWQERAAGGGAGVGAIAPVADDALNQRQALHPAEELLVLHRHGRQAADSLSVMRIPALLLVARMVCAACSPEAARAQDGWVSVEGHLPDGWQETPGIDLRPAIQQALDQQSMLFFPGSMDPEEPLSYPSTTGLTVRPGCRVRFGAHARLVRLPSAGVQISLGSGARLAGAVIDGSKYSHWPTFRDLGKRDAAVVMASDCIVEDVAVFNSPGIAFMSHGHGNRIYRCRAENVGYIDLRFGALFYQGDRARCRPAPAGR